MKKILIVLFLMGIANAGYISEKYYVTPIANGKWASANFTIIGTGNVLASVNNTTKLTIKSGAGGLDVTGAGVNNFAGKIKVESSGASQVIISANTGNPSLAIIGNGSFPLMQMTDGRAGGKNWNIENGRVLGSLDIYHSDTSVTAMSISPTTGYVGIGTTAPSTKLEVNGTVSANDFGTGVLDFAATTVNCAGWSDISQEDMRYKLEGKICYMTVWVVGTSNSINTRIALPYVASTAFYNVTGGQRQPMTYIYDNGAVKDAIGTIDFSGASSLATVYLNANATVGGWTASGAKRVGGSFWYLIN